jgi:hypothetical protein
VTENSLREAFSEAGTKRRQQLAMLRQLVLSELLGGLWHTTHPERFRGILGSHAILFEPPGNPNPDGWRTISGEPYCSYARKLGGISLFDFDGFEPDSYGEKYPMSSWQTFVPYQANWGSAVWIEIDREQIAGLLISGADLAAKWKAEEAFRHTIMPYIEAACLGPIPQAAFKRAFLVHEGDSQIQPLSVSM